MRNLSFLIVVMTLAFFGCQRDQKNQTVSVSSENEFGKDSCLIITFTDSTQCRYELVRDSANDIQMKDGYQKVFSLDIQKHGLPKAGDITADITSWFIDGCSLTLYDSIHDVDCTFSTQESWYLFDEIKVVDVPL